jgi:signal transduction histidine kinase
VTAGTPVPPRARRPWQEFWATPLRVRAYLAVVGLAAAVLPWVLRDLGPHSTTDAHLVTASVLAGISVLNVEIGRHLSGGLSRTQQPHKALSAWAFASALLLPTPWLLVVVPLTYAHARWRGIRLPLWKWIGSAAFLVLAGTAVAVFRSAALGESSNWMAGTGGVGLPVMIGAAMVFLATESLLLGGSAVLGTAEDEAWLRRTLTGWSFYATETGVLLIGGLLSAVWTGGAWYVVLFVPIYALAQRAALHEPLRERAEAAAVLADRNRDLEQANQFKIDLMGVLGHEIGNPLTAILGHSDRGAEALAEGDTTTARRSFEGVERSALQVGHVLHDLLVLVSSDRGALTAHPQPTPLHAHLAAAAEAQPGDDRPVVRCPPGLGALVQPSHLDQVLSNLVANATKYAGGATSIAARETGSGTVEVSVADQGPGVPEAFRDQLFERFSREAASAHRVLGTGLGLFIARELARANGGDLLHRPGPGGVGAEFVVVLRTTTTTS